MAAKVWTVVEQGIEQMKASMEKLQAKPIDLMQVHNLVDKAAHLDTLRGWKKEGLVRYIGITTTPPASRKRWRRCSRPRPGLRADQLFGGGARCREDAAAAGEGSGRGGDRESALAGGEAFKKLSANPLPDWAKEIDCTSAQCSCS